jgi:hypothetical protein
LSLNARFNADGYRDKRVGFDLAFEQLKKVLAGMCRTDLNFNGVALNHIAVALPTARTRPEFLFNAHELVILGDTFAAAGSAGLDLSRPGRDHEISAQEQKRF